MKSNFPDLILAIDQMNDRSSIIVQIYFILIANGRGNQSNKKKTKKNRRKYLENFFCRRIEDSSIKNERLTGFSSLKIPPAPRWSQIRD
jgi:hypothetical protein